MPKRTLANVSGDIGELSVILDLIKTGCAVNSLAQSDYGWDAHVHTPTDVVDVFNLPKDSQSWQMSGLSAHIQIKNALKGKQALVKVGSLRAWLAGSKVGTPTFYFFVDQEKPRYASPKMLQGVLMENEGKADEEEIGIGKRKTREADYAIFTHLLRLWTRYPRILLHRFVTVDDWHLLEAADLEGQQKAFVAQVFLAWLQSHQPKTPVPEPGYYPIIGGEAIVWAAADELYGLNAVDDQGSDDEKERASALRIGLHEWIIDSLVRAARHLPDDASEGRKAMGPLWPEASLATSYALATSPEAASLEASRLVRDVISYYNFCVARK